MKYMYIRRNSNKHTDPYVQGEQNMNSDFFLKENPDSTVCFESVTSPRALVTIGEGLNVQINFNLFLLASEYSSLIHVHVP